MTLGASGGIDGVRPAGGGVASGATLGGRGEAEAGKCEYFLRPVVGFLFMSVLTY